VLWLVTEHNISSTVFVTHFLHFIGLIRGNVVGLCILQVSVYISFAMHNCCNFAKIISVLSHLCGVSNEMAAGVTVDAMKSRATLLPAFRGYYFFSFRPHFIQFMTM
jgi:hypothetical protein